MSVRNVLLAIFIPPIIGGLIPFFFASFTSTAMSEVLVCSMLQTAAQKGIIKPSDKRAIAAEAIAASSGDATAKSVFEAVQKRGC